MREQGESKLAFVGCGAFGAAIIRGLVENGGYNPANIWATRRSVEQLAPLADLGVHTGSDNLVAIEAADYVFLCMRPQQLLDFFYADQEFYAQLSKPVVSVIAGASLSLLQRFLPEAPIIRSMPNLASNIQKGITGLLANSRAGAADCAEVSTIFSLLGEFIWLEREELLHAFTALSGSGIAYFYFLMETMIRSARAEGFSEGAARFIVEQTAFGAIALLQQTGVSSAEVLSEVKLPGGTTEAAINSFEFNQVDYSTMLGIQAAIARSRAISEELLTQSERGALYPTE